MRKDGQDTAELGNQRGCPRTRALAGWAGRLAIPEQQRSGVVLCSPGVQVPGIVQVYGICAPARRQTTARDLTSSMEERDNVLGSVIIYCGIRHVMRHDLRVSSREYTM